jgi:pimeloyl-ACP methyl ester carboxylesterase
MVEERVNAIGHSAADPAAVWAVAGDFCGDWHPAIAEIRAERDARGALIRAFTAKGEDTLYRERLVYRSDSDRVLVYTHMEGIAGAERYIARLQVLPGKCGGSRIEWSAELAAEGERAAAIAAGTKAIFEMGVGALTSLGEDPSPTPPHKGEGLSLALASRPPLGGAVPQVFSPLVGEMADRPERASSLGGDASVNFIEGTPRLALTVLRGNAANSLFSPAGRSAERMRGDEGVAGGPKSKTRSSDPSGHLLPAGEKRERTLTLFLHGIGGGRTNWLPQLVVAAPYAEAAALDLRGYGDSQLGPSQSTVEDYCADILLVMETLSATRVILCGLSYGSWIATSFAMRHPEKLGGLVLSGGCTGMSEASAAEREAFRQSREVPLDKGKTPADFAAAVVNVLAGPDAGAAVRRKLFDSMAAIPSATYRDALNCFTNPPERFDFAKLTMPVLMMTGEHDRLAPPAEIRSVANRIAGTAPNAYVRFEVISGAGHVCNVERPEAYNAVLTEFLSEVAR